MSDEKKTPTSNKEGKLTAKTVPNVDEALQQFNKTPVEEPKKKTNWVMLIVLPIVIAAGLYCMIKLVGDINDADSAWSFNDLVSNVSVQRLLLAIGIMLFIMFAESLKYFIVTHAVTNKFKPLDSIKVAFVGKYYDDITPFSAGGQPMQIVYLHKKGHSAGTSSAIVLIKYSIQIMCWVTICFLLMIINRGVLDANFGEPLELWGMRIPVKEFLLIAGWIGWVVNALLPLSIIFFAIFPKFTNKMLEFFINKIINISWHAANRKERKTGKSQYSRKAKLVRRKRKWIGNANAAVDDFRSSFVVMAHKPAHFIALILTCVCEQLLSWAFPFFVLIAFAKELPATWELAFMLMTLNVYSAMSVTVVPTPGNSGPMEIVMGVAIAGALPKLVASASIWVLLGWRFSTYYIYIIVGIFITLFEFIRKLVRNRKQNNLSK
ncbi:MAG: flippase-like domain-containing protein [Clostridia bacterium]|nr:flippase-like domain-containing protein [Clostridia bacterium]